MHFGGAASLFETAGCANIIFIFWKFPGRACQIQEKRLFGFAKSFGARCVAPPPKSYGAQKASRRFALAKRLINQSARD
jgi:hypothetical protein